MLVQFRSQWRKPMKATGSVHSGYAFHKGRIAETLQALLGKIDLENIRAVGYTSSSRSVIKKGRSVDSRVAYITAARHLHPGGTIIADNRCREIRTGHLR